MTFSATDKLLNALRLRELQANDALDDDSFQFWNTLNKESRYSVRREDVKKAYKNAGKLQFPWHNLADDFVLIGYQFDNPNGIVKQKKCDERPDVLEIYLKNLEALKKNNLTHREEKSVKETVSTFKQQQKQIKENNGKPRVNKKFTTFNNLRANQISLVMMEGGKAKMIINKKRIDIFPNDFKLNEKSQGWKLLEGAAASNGDLQLALKTLNKTNNREAEKNKTSTAISRLNVKLKESMGLEEGPILCDAGCYRFTFKSMTHELIGGLNVTKGADAMNHLSEDGLDEINSNQGFWQDNE